MNIQIPEKYDEFIDPLSQETIKIRTEKLNFFYGKSQALFEIDLPIVKNAITALMGPSGCGKSTLLRTFDRLCDLYPDQRTEGRILLDGADLLSPDVDVMLLRSKIGMVFQQPTPLPMSVFDNVAFGLRITGNPSKPDLAERVEHALQRAALWDEVKDDLDKPGVELSGGQQQRLCVARCIVVEPEVLLLDEPASGLDPISAAQLEQTIVEMKRDFTIVIVTHNLQQAARISEFTAFMYLGHLIEFGYTKQIFDKPRAAKTAEYIHGGIG